MTGLAPASLRWIWHERISDPAWIDYNGHLNVAFYALVFDHALDAALDALDLGPAYRAATGGSVFVLETHTRFLREVLAGAELVVGSRLIAADQRRVVFHHRMGIADQPDPVATQDALGIHVDLTTRRARPWPAASLAQLTALAAADGPPPAGAGEAFRLRHRG
jgi:acyl-CoA thioester hydrolase